MVHKFDPQNKKRLDTEERRAIMPPSETLVKLGFKKTDVMADIGCGAGYFTLPAALIIDSNTGTGSNSCIFALDTSEDMLAEVTEKALDLGLKNISCFKTSEYDLKIQDNCVDFALICNVLHEISDKPKFIAEVMRIMKPGAILAVIEWQKRRGEYGPSEEERIDKNQLRDQLVLSGLSHPDDFDFIESFYAVTATK